MSDDATVAPAAANDDNQEVRVEIYSTETCGYCHMAKEFMDANGVKYNDHNVGDPANAEFRDKMIALTGQMGVPVIVVKTDVVDDDGNPKEEIMVGFNEEKLSGLLGLAKTSA